MGLRRAVVPFVLALTSAAHAQDFDPRGRHRPQPAAPSAGNKAPALGPDGAAATTSQAALIERYTRVVLAQPGVAFPLQRLAQLYRDRDGNVARLVSDFESRASQAGPEQYAATATLAGLYKLEGHSKEAIAAYERASALKPDDAGALLALAHLLEDDGDAASARSRYEHALSLQMSRADKEQTLRTLMGLALDAKDWDGAKAFHRALTALENMSFFVRGELARELSSRGEYVRAEAELKDVAAAAAGDNRALAPALKELGRAQAKAHEDKDALSTLQRALAAAGPESALRAEIYEIVAGIYRANQQLPALIQQLDQEHPTDPARLALLGRLYEETGDSTKAIATYRRALALDPRQIDLRLRMIRLLQSNGELDRAIGEYETLVRAAPDNPQFVFEECEALLQRGDHARALALVANLESRASGDDEVLSRVADFYARIGENEKSLKVLQRLAESNPGGDAGHIVDLGDRYFQDGNVPLALQTWKRILVVVSPRAKALSALGDVYLEHDLTADAVAAYKEASQIDPSSLPFKKALAAAYERAHAYREARQLYEEVVKRGTGNTDKALVRECRTRIVTLWGLERILDQEVTPLEGRFNATPPDIEAGKMLAEALLHLRRLPEADATLRRVINLAPGDPENYLALERVLVQENRIADAIALLERLSELEPKRARELYQRMAQYALEIYKDDDAISFAARAVALNPDDAEGHRHLGEMYRSKQDIDHAISEFRAAIAKNDRLFVIYFELADLLLSKGSTDEADHLFRAVVRGAPDEELVARAARLSMQINLGKGTLESLEQDLLPLAIGNPQRPVYRKLLVEIYGSMTFGLVARVKHGAAPDAEDARQTLTRIGSRAVKPLLDALADHDVSQQRIAIDVLAYVQNRNAALPLFAFAAGPSDVALRTRAMLACGAIAEGSLLPKYEVLLFPKQGAAEQPELADSVGVAAAWGVARMNDLRAVPLLRRIAASGSPSMRALAVLGLGMVRDTASAAAVAEIARSADSGTLARAAAAYALGDLGDERELPTLLEIAEDGDALPRSMALLALARMAGASGREPRWKGAAVKAMSDGLFAAGGEEAAGRRSAQAVARASVAALAIMATRGAGVGGWAREKDAMPAADGGEVDVDRLLDRLVPPEAREGERAVAFVAFSEPIRTAALSALRTSGERARAVLASLGEGDGEFLPFVPRGSTGGAADAARALQSALEPSIIPLTHHPDAQIRTAALVLAARSASDAGVGAVLAGLDDPSEAVQRVALAYVGRRRGAAGRDERTIIAVTRVLAHNESWAMRVLAAQALGRLGASGGAGARPPLMTAATTDRYALVRQAALEALAAFDKQSARSLAEEMASSDPEPRVRQAAKALVR